MDDLVQELNDLGVIFIASWVIKLLINQISD